MAIRLDRLKPAHSSFIVFYCNLRWAQFSCLQVYVCYRNCTIALGSVVECQHLYFSLLSSWSNLIYLWGVRKKLMFSDPYKKQVLKFFSNCPAQKWDSLSKASVIILYPLLDFFAIFYKLLNDENKSMNGCVGCILIVSKTGNNKKLWNVCRKANVFLKNIPFKKRPMH